MPGVERKGPAQSLLEEGTELGSGGRETCVVRKAHARLFTSACDERQDTFQQNPQESQEYKIALARTRQAVSVQKALQLKNEGSQARCVAIL